MKHIIKNWRTTIAGVLTISAGLALYLKGDKEHGVAFITTGIGLIASKDAQPENETQITAQ